jgi:hypothetical protein
MWDIVWNGADRNDGGEDDYVEEMTMTDSFLLDNHIFYEPKLRWNKNTKPTREKVCWVCGVKTNNYYQHLWRIQGGKIANVKCECCYNEYLKNKKGKGNV